MADRIQLRRDTSTNWSAANPVLASGEQGFETDTLKLKIGNGVSAWNSLAYVIDVSSLATSADVTSAVNNLIDAAPGTLDTLNELAAALGDDANFASTVTSSLALKADTTTVNSSLALKADTTTVNSSLALKADTSSLATVATSGAYADVTGTPSIPSALTDLSITDGTVGQVLTTDGSGGFTFADTAGGGSFEAVASGTLANGDRVIVNSDGTVSVVGLVNAVADSASTVSVANFHSSNVYGVNAHVHSYTNKVIITFADVNNGNLSTVVVGEISGSSITFGSTVVYVNSQQMEADIVSMPGNKFALFHNDGTSRDATDIGQITIGTISGTSVTLGSPVDIPGTGYGYPRTLTYEPSTDKLVIGTDSASGLLQLRTGTVSGNNVTFGNTVNIDSVFQSSLYRAYDPSTNQIIYVMERNGTVKLRLASVSGTSVSLGSANTIATSSSAVRPVDIEMVVDTNQNKVVMAFQNSNGWTRHISLGSISGSSITISPSNNVQISSANNAAALVFDSTLNKTVMVYHAAAGLTGQVIDTSGSYASFESAFLVDAGSSFDYKKKMSFDATSGRIVSIFKNSDTARVAMISSASASSNLTSENFVGVSDGAYASGATATIQTAGAIDDAQSGLTAGQAYFLKGDGTLNTTPDTPRVFAGVALSATELMIGRDMSSTAVVPYTDSDVATYLTGNGYDTATNIVASITDSAPATLDTLNELAAALGDDANFAGTVTTSLAAKANTADLSTVATTGAYSDLTGTPVPGGSFDAVASGTLENGDKVVINSDGTVSVVEQNTIPQGAGTPVYVSGLVSNISVTFDSNSNKVVVSYPVYLGPGSYEGRTEVGTVSGKSISFGSPVTFHTGTGSILQSSATFDSNSNKVVIAFTTSGDNLGQLAVVGTVSGTSISFGAPTAFNTYAGNYELAVAATFDSNSNKVVIAYTESYSGTNKKAIVGTVSGNSISFGSPVTFSTTAAWGDTDVTFDSNSNKVVIAYTDVNYGGSPAKAIVGTVSGTSISFGTEVVFDSGNGSTQYSKAVFDSNSNKVVIAYRAGSQGKAIVGTVSGTSISFGSSNMFENAAISGVAATFDSRNNKVLITYRDYGNSSYGTAVVGTVSGTGITFSSPSVYSSAETAYAFSTFDSHNNKAVIVFEGSSGSSTDVVVYQTVAGIVDTNLTSENFVGISDGAYASGATATIQTAGSVDDAQSGLTASQAYFVQADGTIATTAGTPRVFAGVALSATELMIGKDLPADAVVTYTDSDVATYLSGNGYDTATNIISTITDSAPATLDTLNELAAALGDDANFASTVTSSLALKADTSSLATVATTGAYSDLTGTPAAVVPGGSFEATASGTLANGDTVIINADGTVSLPSIISPSASLLRTLDNPNAYGTSANDRFGQYVAISDNYTIVGANGEDDAGGDSSGKVYIYNNSTGALVHTLDNPNPYGTSANDGFGNSVAISDTYAIVGANGEDDSGLSSGKAYIYNVSTGALLHTLDNPNAYDTSAYDYFGSVVAISDNYAIVGANGEDDAGGTGSGKAYIYNNSTGALLHTLDNPNAYDTSGGDNFGWSVAITDTYAIVGASTEKDASGNPIGYSSGKAYIFNVSTGALLHTLDNPNPYDLGNGDQFGNSVAISGNYAIVAAYGEDDAGGTNSGKAYIFNVSTGALVHTLDNPNAYDTSANDEFGYSVAISDTYAIVAAHQEDDASGTGSGKVYIFNVSTGALVHTLDNPNPYGTSENDFFGIRIAISDTYAIVGSREDDAGGTDSGKAYIYEMNNTPSTTLTAENFVGISDGAYANGATATIQTAGSVDDAQSGLTAGQAYYVQGNGTLGLTPDTTRVFAGVALSATELMIGRDMSSAAVAAYTDSDVATYLSGNDYATQTATIAAITASAPATLDTLNELAAALGDDANFASTVTSSLALKANTSSLATVATSGAYSDLTGTPAAVVPGGSFDAVASGTLANGDKVVVNADGTVSVVSPTGGPVISTDPAGFGTQVVASSEANNQDKSFAVFDSNTNKVVVLYNATVGGVNGARVIVGTVSGKSISFGSPVAIVGAIMTYGDITFDSNANKVVVVMSNFSNSSRGEAYVGTVSGTSISFGSAVVFENSINTSYPAATFDSNTNKVVVAYNAFSGGFGGRAIVGTVSGNSISFGSSVALPESRPSFTRATFDSNSNKVVLVYKEESSTNGVAVVGTVSGDSISFGSPTSFVVQLQYYPGVAIDSSSKMVVAYRDPANSYYGTAKVGTISGTSISFGSAVVFESVNAPYTTDAIFDSSANKFLIAYTDYNSGTPLGKIIKGTVSGTSISFASPVVFDTLGGRFNTTTMTFDSASNKAVLVFGTSNNNHESVVYQAEDQDIRGPNLTSENFVGISNAAYSDGATATIQTAGSVDDTQSGLTAGQAYFVQGNGTLGLTPDTPRVFAGVALSATELMIGRDLPAIRDTVYALTGTALDRANGGIQTKTLAANTTFTDSLVSGDSLVLQLEAGASYTVTWPTMQWVTSGGNVAPTLTAKDTLVFWKVSSTLYGAYTGSYV